MHVMRCFTMASNIPDIRPARRALGRTTQPARADLERCCAGKTALEDILPVLCPSALNHATTLRVMERLQADSYRYDINGYACKASAARL